MTKEQARKELKQTMLEYQKLLSEANIEYEKNPKNLEEINKKYLPIFLDIQKKKTTLLVIIYCL